MAKKSVGVGYFGGNPKTRMSNVLAGDARTGGRAKYNAATGSKLKPPAPSPKTEADKGRKASFCARMGGVVAKSKNAERAKASMRRWKC